MKSSWKISDVKFEYDGENPFISVNSWLGHRPFAYDLINFIEPECLVELGTHTGCSFFSFCKSALDNALKTKIIAIDSWLGDEQAGFYGNEIFEFVDEFSRKKFSGVDYELKRMIFDSALDEIPDNSIDILHIDGLHTYEAVSHDYYSWLPKLKRDGIVLFHDIAKDFDYGSHYFWEELKTQEDKYFEFQHSCGLGMLFPKGDSIYDTLISLDIDEKLEHYKYRGAYSDLQIRNAVSVNHLLNALISERDEIVMEYKELISMYKKNLDTYDKLVHNLQDKIVEKDAIIRELKDKIAGI